MDSCLGQPAFSMLMCFIMSMTFNTYVLLTVLGEEISRGCIGVRFCQCPV
jgi:hypothetical protein